MTKLLAPWTREQVAALNKYQSCGFMHPFTCDGGGNCRAILEATPDGWVCPLDTCEYFQDWAYAEMITIDYGAYEDYLKNMLSKDN